MAKDIELKIYMPEKLVLSDKVYRAVLPFDNKTITVLKGRAPTLIVLERGVIQILNEENNVIDEWLVSGGCADIKQDTCTILTEACFNKKELNYQKAQELNKDFPNPFYQWIEELFEKQERYKAK